MISYHFLILGPDGKVVETIPRSLINDSTALLIGEQYQRGNGVEVWEDGHLRRHGWLAIGARGSSGSAQPT